MDSHEREGLRMARRAERDPRVRDRMLAVRHVLDHGMTHVEAASLLDCDEKAARLWVSRYAEGGVDALRDLPRPGRPREVGREDMEGTMDGGPQPHARAEDMRQAIHDRTGIPCHTATVRRRMHEHGLSPKRGHPVHVNRASGPAVRGWQWRAGAGIPEMEAAGFTVVAQDGATVTRGAGAGQGFWSRRGERVLVPHAGSRRKAVAYAPVAPDGRRPCELHEKSGASTFVAHLKSLLRKFGRVAVLLDRAPRHRAREAGEFVLGCGGDVRLACLPVGTPEPDVVEELWHQLRRLLVGLHVPDFEDFRRVLGGLLGTMPHGLDACACLKRKAGRNRSVPRR